MQYLYFGLFMALLAVIYIAAMAKSIEMAMLGGAFFFLILIPSAIWGLMKEDEEREKHK